MLADKAAGRCRKPSPSCSPVHWLRSSLTAAATAACAAGTTLLFAPVAVAAADPFRPSFFDVTGGSGLLQVPSQKSRGPLVADFDADGTYDLVLSNHFHTRTRVYWGVPGTTRYTGGDSLLPSAQDVHGITAGDLGRGEGGRKHILVTIGGTAGKGLPRDTNPRPPRLYEIRANRSWVDVTRRWGLSAARARGRSARLVDLTGSGRLDAVLFGSAVIVPWDKSPRQNVYLNSAGG